MDLQGKKLLILGGAFQHIKLVRAAKELGVYTIVTDYLPDSPAKQIADKAYKVDIKDVPALIELCKNEKVDGVLHGYIDPCQRPYSQLCKALNYHCFGSEEQYFNLTDKHAFKKLCNESGVDTIEEYSLDDIRSSDANIKYPVFVKPVDSRGSRGMTICNSADEVYKALELAKKESSNGDVVIEQYLGGYKEFQVTYFFINGEPFLLRTADRHLGRKDLNLDKVGICTISPSFYTKHYINNGIDRKVISMFKKLGIKNGPVFMQGFIDGNTVRFFDPGFRFPGGDYENMFKDIMQLDLMQQMVIFSLTGAFNIQSLPEQSVYLKGKKISILFPTVMPGKISAIEGIDSIIKSGTAKTIYPKYLVGDVVPAAYNVNQRFAEVDIIGEDNEDLFRKIKYVQKHLIVKDKNNNNMIFGEIDTDELKSIYS